MIFTTTRLVPLATLLLPLVSATFSFNTFVDSSSPDESFALDASWGISGPCTTAFNAEISCEDTILQGSRGMATEDRQGFCTNQCIDGLRRWRDGTRADCSVDDVKAATSQLSDISPNSTVVSGSGPAGAMLLAAVSDSTLMIVEQLYFQSCLRDLKSGDLCPEIPSFGTGPDSRFDAATACPNTCTTQAYFLANSVAQLYGDEAPAQTDIQTLCPDVDFSVFPQTLSQKPLASYSFESPNDSTDNTTTNSTTENDKKNGAAAALGGSLWGMGGTIAAVGIAMFVF